MHQVMIKDNDNMRQQANSLDAGTGVLIHGSLNSNFVRDEEGKSRIMYYIRPRQLIVSQPTEIDFELLKY